jgi:hypothetical protein
MPGECQQGETGRPSGIGGYQVESCLGGRGDGGGRIQR